MRQQIARFRGSTLAKNTVWMFIGQAFSMSMKAGYFLIVARALGSQQYGAFVGVTALVSILAPYATLGSGNLLIKNVSRDRSLFHVYWGNSLIISLVSGLALMVVALTVGDRILASHRPFVLLLTVAISDLLFARIVDISGQAFQGLEMLSRTALLSASINAARFVGAIIVAVFVDKPTASTWALVYLASALIAAAEGVYSIHRRFGRPSLSLGRMRGETVEGCFFAASQSAQNIYNDIDKTMLARLSTLEATGIYGAAYRLIDVAFVPVRSILFAAYPGFFRHGSMGLDGSRRYAQSLLPRAAAAGGMASAVIYLSAPLIPVLLGHQYTETANALRLLSPLPLIKSIHYFEADMLTGAGYQGVRTGVQAFVAVCNIALNLWLIPLHSWRGAAWSSLASDSLLTITLFLVAVVIIRCDSRPTTTQTAGTEEVEHAI